MPRRRPWTAHVQEGDGYIRRHFEGRMVGQDSGQPHTAPQPSELRFRCSRRARSERSADALMPSYATGRRSSIPVLRHRKALHRQSIRNRRARLQPRRWRKLQSQCSRNPEDSLRLHGGRARRHQSLGRSRTPEVCSAIPPPQNVRLRPPTVPVGTALQGMPLPHVLYRDQDEKRPGLWAGAAEAPLPRRSTLLRLALRAFGCRSKRGPMDDRLR